MMRAGAGLILALLAALPTPAQQGHFRQYIEAEDCALDNLKPGENRLGSYVGARFVFNIIEGL